MLRTLAAVLLASLAALSALAAWGALSNLWADYQDSPAITYVIFGVPFALVSVASLVALVRLLRR